MTSPVNQSLFHDIQVVELATMVFAPAASIVLAEFGANVIKVEPPEGDLNRNYHKLPGLPVSDFPYTFEADNRNKKSVVLDLKSSSGYEAFCKLLSGADVFVTNYRMKALERMKLDYDTLKESNPQLIYALGTGYGELGEERDKPGYDAVCYWTRSGIENTVFPHEGWISPFPFGAGDHPSGMSLFAAIMTGLYQRMQTGKGCKVSTSLLANGAWANATLLQAQLSNAEFRPKRPRHNAYNFAAQHYKTKDGRLFKLTIVNIDKGWPAFCNALSREDILNDLRFAEENERLQNIPALIQEFDATIGAQDFSFWEKRLEQFDIPFSVVSTYEEAGNDPQKEANGIFVPLNHPEQGQIRAVSSPLSIDGIDKVDASPAPKLGEHTSEVLSSLGYSDEEITNILNRH